MRNSGASVRYNHYAESNISEVTGKEFSLENGEKFKQESDFASDRVGVIIDDIWQAVKDSLESDWDGYGALPVNAETCKHALNFLLSNPEIPVPNFGCEPNGRMGMEWIVPNGGIAAAFDSDGKITFGGVINSKMFSGKNIDDLLKKLISSGV